MTLDISKYPHLALADTPDELRLLPIDSLPQVCDELRTYLLKSVSQTSGHFASGLGVVELTVALHYVYNTPFDHLIWDVGHQAYPHKILTGRRERMNTIRQKMGFTRSHGEKKVSMTSCLLVTLQPRLAPLLVWLLPPKKKGSVAR